jgi:hypothetical protein
MGGLGALFCDRDLHGAADALVLLSPFVGDSLKVFKEIAASGGPATWAKGDHSSLFRVGSSLASENRPQADFLQ